MPQVETTFRGTIRPLRRGGFAARGLLVVARSSQVYETQVGPREFASEDLCDAWLRSAAAGMKVERVQIVTASRPEPSQAG